MNATTRFDAAAYWEGGNCPWTFFAYPRVVADDAGLPPDNDAKRLLAALQAQGIPVGTWVMEDTAYFACPKEAIGRLMDAIRAMEKQGEFPEGFCAQRTQDLFSSLDKST